jgi:hypothetical protein
MDWFGNMFLHSGKWGSGDKNIFDFQNAGFALTEMVNMDSTIFYLMGFLSLQLLITFIVLRVRKDSSQNLLMWITFVYLLGISLSIILITKHFAGHYFIPTLVLKIFLLYLIAENFLSLLKSRWLKRGIPIVALIYGLFIFSQQLGMVSRNVKNSRLEADNFERRELVLEKYKTKGYPLILTSYYRGAVFQEASMVAGVLMSGSLKTTFTKRLQEKYPNSYFFYEWTNAFYFWDLFKNSREFIQAEEPVYVWIGDGKEAALPIILERIQEDFEDYEVEVVLLHVFESPAEYFYEVKLSSKITDSDQAESVQ